MITCNMNPLFYANSVIDSIVVQYVSAAQVRSPFTICNETLCLDIVEPITVLINNSFYHGIFPDEMKLAMVVSIFKSGDS